MWGQRTQQPRPTSYRAQGPCRGRRNARGRTKRVQIAKRHCRVLSSANRDHKKEEQHAFKDSLLRHPKKKGLAQWASHGSMMEEQFQKKLSPLH